MTEQRQKMFVDIVWKIRAIMEEDHLTAGDKIPSERELSERLSCGRSSVREALRALELLGLIETRRGEGTFIRDFKDHHLIKLLGSFLLREDIVQQDLLETRTVLEKDCLRLCILNDTLNDKLFSNLPKTYEALIHTIVENCGNQLLYRIWTIVYDYCKVTDQPSVTITPEFFDSFVETLLSKNLHEVFELYDKKMHVMSKAN
ncbi:FadR family transcriptional regulator [Bacillus sp. HMF5848]|uniref:FadR/GntR family transcriptional regulator n=1 Tax=Bacillus sp. HMF5848 TaxID=2495421 RepID=UPI000F76C915|nr:GntR family transcriptional regulator [Bacillus sp. HMF5848]RSK28139.1 FadR family transcriptional regulator [Bacillus sp. HMF5848]